MLYTNPGGRAMAVAGLDGHSVRGLNSSGPYLRPSQVLANDRSEYARGSDLRAVFGALIGRGRSRRLSVHLPSTQVPRTPHKRPASVAYAGSVLVARSHTRVAFLALLAMAAAWGSPFIKDLVTRIPVTDLLAIRFAIAAALGLIVGPRVQISPPCAHPGRAARIVVGSAQVLQTAGLAHTAQCLGLRHWAVRRCHPTADSSDPAPQDREHHLVRGLPCHVRARRAGAARVHAGLR